MVFYEVVCFLNEIGCIFKEEGDFCILLKVCKNEMEFVGIKEVYICDGVVLMCFFYWIGEEGLKGNVDEIFVVKKLELF